jgi:hypothetical protein
MDRELKRIELPLTVKAVFRRLAGRRRRASA